jgi:integrase
MWRELDTEQINERIEHITPKLYRAQLKSICPESLRKSGFRCGKVCRLQLADVELERGVLTIARTKNSRARRFPLTDEALFAVRKYICEGRPKSASQALSISHVPPYGTLSRGTVYKTCSRLFKKNEVKSPRRGSYAFRHACAMQLMKTGFSLRENRSFLGHKTVSQYARYDIESLRAVANLSLAGLDVKILNCVEAYLERKRAAGFACYKTGKVLMRFTHFVRNPDISKVTALSRFLLSSNAGGLYLL